MDEFEFYGGFEIGNPEPVSPEKGLSLQCFHAKERVRQMKCFEKTAIFSLLGVKWSKIKR